MARFLAKYRMAVLVVLGTSVYIAVSRFNMPLWEVLAAGALLGVVFGKVFCRWMCPIGIIMELVMSASGDGKARQLYQYHKVGCPIAWVSGLLNRVSLFKIRNDKEKCRECGICDAKCYVTSVEPEKYSFFRQGLRNPAESYTCSRCLECVAACPAKSLGYGVKK